MRRVWFWLRWVARDLRSRWQQVAAIALTIAIGVGLSAGIGSMTAVAPGVLRQELRAARRP